MRDLHIVLPSLNLSLLDAGILRMVKQVGLMMFSLNMVDYLVLPLIVHLEIYGGHIEGTILRCSYSLSFVVGPLFHTKKLWWVGGWWWWPTGF